MKTSFKGRKWNGPVDEEGRPHGRGKMYEIRQKYGYKSYASVEEYYADGYFDSAGRFVSSGSTPRNFGDSFLELVFEGECCHGEWVLKGCVIHRDRYRAESVYVDGVPTDDFIIYFEGRKFFEGQVDVKRLLDGFQYACPYYIKGKEYYKDEVSVKFEGEFHDGRTFYSKGKLWYPDGKLWFEGEYEECRPARGKVYRRDGSLWWDGGLCSAAFYDPRNGYVSYDHRGEPWAYFSGEGMLYDENGENPRYTCINV